MPDPQIAPQPAPVQPPPEQGVNPPLPPIYDSISKARQAGYSWDEINTHLTDQRTKARAAGYSDEEINTFLGFPKDYGRPTDTASNPPPVLPSGEGSDQAAQTVRAFRDKFLTPSPRAYQSNLFSPLPSTAGQFLKDQGTDLLDIGKIFGYAAASGLAAGLEMMDGRPRSTEEWSTLNAEATQFTSLLADGVVPKGRPMPAGLPAVKDVLDAAGSISKQRGAPDLTTVARNLGQHFVETGEHPLDAADRAQSQPALMGKLTTSGRASRENPITGEIGPITPETIGMKNPAVASGVLDDLKRIFNPAARTPESEETAGIIRESMATAAIKGQRSADVLHQFGRAVGDLAPEDQGDFLHAIETGKVGVDAAGNRPWAAGSPLDQLSQALRKELDDRWQEMDERGIAPGYIENYLQHLYKDPNAAGQKLAQYFTRRTMEGAKAFKKDRYFSTYLDAKNELGLEPLTTNPIELTLTTLHQMDRYITAKDAFEKLKERGLVEQVDYGEIGKPGGNYASGYEAINDKIARGANGIYVAPEPVATILNRYLSPGLSGRPIYDTLRSAGNMLNSAQLSLSGFHFTFVTADAFMSAGAKGLKQISRATPEEVVRGIGSILRAPAAPFSNYYMGSHIIKQLLGKSTGQETLADALIASGGRIGMDPVYASSAMGSFWNNMKGSVIAAGQKFRSEDGTGPMTFSQAVAEMYRNAAPIKAKGVTILPGAVRATAMMVPRVMQTVMAPLMEHFVPVMKVGAWASLMKDELRINPTMTREELQATGYRLWHSVDNRLGQLVYDNRFWDKTARDLGHIGVRSLGWNAGTLDEGIGGIADLMQGRKIAAGQMNQISDRASYVLFVPLGTAFIGSIFGFLHGTWNSDWGIKDYMFPPTGGKDAQGGVERASMPGYFKDYYQWSTQPFTEAENKIHPLWTDLYDMMTNRRWNGAVITDPRESLFSNIKDYASFLVDQFKPISFKGQPGDQATGLSGLENAIGLKPAPYSIREPERQENFENKELQDAVAKKRRMDNQP